jgi:L-amino acid N-acyltransferase YncA
MASTETKITRREEHTIGKYKVTLLYTEGDQLLGAIVEGPRLSRPVYIAAREESSPKIPKPVKKFLSKYGFKLK